jgi:hypothetical protein
MSVVLWPGKTRGAVGFACPFFWFFFWGKQKKRTKELAEGNQAIKKLRSILTNPLTKEKYYNVNGNIPIHLLA